MSPSTAPPARPPRGAARRELIVEAALAVVAEIGPDALTHRRVAAEAGVPLAATTYWFASKDQLVLEAFELAAERDLARLAASMDVVATWTRETLADELAQVLHRQLTEHRGTTIVDCSLWVETVRRPELRALAERWSEAYFRFHADLLQTIAPATTDDDARLITAALDGLLTQELAHEPRADRAPLAPLVQRLIDAFLPPEAE